MKGLQPGFTGPAAKGADYAQEVIAEMERGTKSRKARVRMIQIVLDRGNYTAEGLNVWRAHARTYPELSK